MKYILILFSISFFFGIYRLFSIDTYSVTLFDIGVFLFYALAAKRIFWDGEVLFFPRSIGFYSVFGLIIAVVLSGFMPILEGNDVKQFQFLKTGIHFLYLVIISILCAGLNIKVEDWKKTIQVTMICAVFIHIFGIYQLVARGLDLPLAWLNISDITLSSSTRGITSADLPTDADGITRQLSINYGNFFRATSIFSEPSAYAGFCNLILICLLVPILRNENPFIPSKKFNILLTVLTVISLFLTFSLTGLVLFFGIIGFAFITDRSKNIIKILKIISIIVILLFITDVIVEATTQISVGALFTQRVGGIISSYTGGHIETTGGESFFSRVSTIGNALDIWFTYPITGIGVGCYYTFLRLPEFGFSDSGVFSALAETGIIGVLTFIGIFFGLFFECRRFLFTSYYQRLNRDTKLMCLFTLYNLLLLSISSITANTFLSSYLWFQIGLILTIISVAYKESSLPMIRVKLVKFPLKVSLTNRIFHLKGIYQQTLTK